MEEAYVVAALAASMEKRGTLFFGEIRGRGRGNDPPDNEAVDFDGKRVALEVTELVDENAIHAARRGELYPWAEWTDAKLHMRIQHLISEKAGKFNKLMDAPTRGVCRPDLHERTRTSK